jgi:hypothetical protein
MKPKKLSRAQRMAILGRAREMFAARCRADRLWKSLVAVSAIPAAQRSSAMDRLRDNAAGEKNSRLVRAILVHIEHNVNKGIKA